MHSETPLNPSKVVDRFKTLLKRAGLPEIRFHDLRHSAATILLTMGVHPKLVQELLGHSQIHMTLDTYSHVLPSIQREMMNKLNDVFGDEEQEEGKGLNDVFRQQFFDNVRVLLEL